MMQLRTRHGRGLASIAAAMTLAALMLLPAWSVNVPEVRAAGAANAQASELVRLINGERAYRGKSTLSLDGYLASKARDGSVWCPNDSSKVVDGRAKDIAVSGYFSHSLRLCPKYTVIDAMATWGYTRGRGEILTYNSGFGTGTKTYTYGCSPSVTTCPGPTTPTYSTTARAMAGWMGSSVHYSIILGSYDRVGCGAWVGSDGTYYYACLVAMGGNPIITPRPAAPAKPAPGGASEPTVAPTPAPTQPPPWPSPSGARAWIATRVVLPTPESDPETGDGTGSVWADLARDPPSGPGQGSPDEDLPQAAQVALCAGGAALTLVIVWSRLGPLRRYRPRGGAGTAH
jgi:uncharacterized protein YkwD